MEHHELIQEKVKEAPRFKINKGLTQIVHLKVQQIANEELQKKVVSELFLQKIGFQSVIWKTTIN